MKRSKVKFLNDKEAMELFAIIVKANLGLTVEEFFERHKKGEYKSPSCDDWRLLKVLMMIPRGH